MKQMDDGRGDEREAERNARIASEWVSFTKRCDAYTRPATYQSKSRWPFGRREKQITLQETIYMKKIDENPRFSLEMLLAITQESVLYLFGTHGAARIEQRGNGASLRVIERDGHVQDGYLVMGETSQMQRQISLEGEDTFLPMGIVWPEFSLGQIGLPVARGNITEGSVNVGSIFAIMVQSANSNPSTSSPIENQVLALTPIGRSVDAYLQNTQFMGGERVTDTH